MLATFAALVFAGVVYFLRDTPERVAAKVDRCIKRGDAACIWSYIPSREKVEAGVSQSEFRRMLREYYRPAVTSLREVSPLAIVPSSEIPGAYAAIRTYRLSNGETTTFSVVAAPTDDGVRALGLLSSLPLHTMDVRYPRLPSDRFTYDRELRALRSDKNILTGMGFKGFWGSDNTGEFSVTWSERISQCEEKLAHLRQREAGAD